MKTKEQVQEVKQRFEEQVLTEEEMLLIRGGEGDPGDLDEDLLPPPPPPPKFPTQ